MKKNTFLLMMSLCLAAYHLSAQSLERFVTGCAGSSIQNDKIQLSFTAGEPVVGSFNTAGLHLNQGFHQVNVEEVTTSIALPPFVNKISAYPNPTENLIILDIQSTKSFEFTLELSDLAGKKQILSILSGKAPGNTKYQIDLSSFSTGVYHLSIKTKKGIPVKIFKIIKM